MWLILLVLVVVALLVIGRTRPAVLDSRLVRIGAGALIVTSGLISFLPGLSTGLLFVFLAPIAMLLIVLGSILNIVKSDKAMRADVAALAVAAQRSGRVWPDDPPLGEVDRVAKHGLRAAPALLSMLRFASEEQLNDHTWSASVEQQAELALCRICGELPSGSRTVYDIRATAAENRRVKQFWEARIRPPDGDRPSK